MVELRGFCVARFKPNDFLGQIFLDLGDRSILDNKPHWYQLHDLDEMMSNKLSKVLTTHHHANLYVLTSPSHVMT